MPTPSAPLHGVRVADFTLHAAGPFCTQLLRMLGADVIKIETAGRPDIFRKPHPVYGRMEAASFDQVSAGKRSIRLNLKHPKATALAKRLVSISDVVAESFRPGVMKRLGLDYETLREVNPRLVMVSVSAAGQTGPDSRHAGYAPLFGAAGGLGALTGFEDGPPVELRHVMDHGTGLAAAGAVLAGLVAQRRTGRSQYVDVAAREVATSFIGEAMLMQAVTGAALSRQGNDMPPCAPHNVYPCAGEDSWISIAVGNDREWQGLVQVAERPEWLRDARFATQALRWEHREVLDAQIAAWTASLPKHELAKRLQAAGVPAFPSCTSADLADDAHLLQRGAVLQAQGPDGSSRKVVGAPWRFAKTPAESGGWTPGLGQDIDEVFGELLGLPQSEIRALQDEEVIW